MRTKKKLPILLLLMALFVGVFVPADRAQAMDKRVKLMLKTSAYGAGAGFLVGSAVWAMGIGGLDNYRNLLIGTSLGLYAGLGLGVFVIATPPEPRAPRNANPYQPKRPVAPDDWMNEDEEIEEYKREDSSHTLSVPSVVAIKDPNLQMGRSLESGTLSKPMFWMPLAQVLF